eukprot:12017839-Ditylum_brightwellii.AAC.1
MSSSSFSAAKKSIAGTSLSLKLRRTTVLESLPKIGIGEPISAIWCIKEMEPLLPKARDNTTNPPNLCIMSNLFVPGTAIIFSLYIEPLSENE